MRERHDFRPHQPDWRQRFPDSRRFSNLASFTNNGSVLIGNPEAPGSFGSLTFDTSNGGSFYNSGTGSISLTDQSSLVFRHECADPTNPDTAIFKNDGQDYAGCQRRTKRRESPDQQ